MSQLELSSSAPGETNLNTSASDIEPIAKLFEKLASLNAMDKFAKDAKETFEKQKYLTHRQLGALNDRLAVKERLLKEYKALMEKFKEIGKDGGKFVRGVADHYAEKGFITQRQLDALHRTYEDNLIKKTRKGCTHEVRTCKSCLKGKPLCACGYCETCPKPAPRKRNHDSSDDDGEAGEKKLKVE